MSAGDAPSPAASPNEALDSARRKAYARLIPLLFLSYVVAYVDRANVGFAKLTMSRDLPAFDNAVIGTGAGLFFLGYFLLEIPGSLLVERWSARKWISRIMISWGLVASLTAWVTTPSDFYCARFLLGLAEAGFFPGVLVFLTHWFPQADRARAFALFLMATPVAQLLGPALSNPLLKIGMTETLAGVSVTHPLVLGLRGWQWVFLAWGLPAVVLGLLVLLWLPDRPRQARWLSAGECDALEAELLKEAAERRGAEKHAQFLEALKQPKVWLLALAFFGAVTANYGLEFFLPSMLERWYDLKLDKITVLLVILPFGALAGQFLNGWSSDRTKERRWHTAVPLALGSLSLAFTPLSFGSLFTTMVLLVLARTGIKAYQPSFWTFPGLFLSSSAAAGSVGLINSIGNLGGFFGPFILGKVEKLTGSFQGGVYYLACSMAVSVVVVLALGLGRRPQTAT